MKLRMMPLALTLVLSLLAGCADRTAAQPPAQSDTGSAAASTNQAEEQKNPEQSQPPGTAWDEQDVLEFLTRYGASLLRFWEEEGHTLVLYERQGEGYLSLALADLENGRLEPLINGIQPESRIAVAEHGISILDPGTSIDFPLRTWPAVLHIALPITPVDAVSVSERGEPYHMPLDQPFTIGVHHGARVERVTLKQDQIYFEFQDDGGLFVGGSPLTPEMQVSFQDAVCTVLFPGSRLDPAFAAETYGDQPIQLLSAQNTPEGALLTFSCGMLLESTSAVRWYVEEFEDPVTWLPRAAVNLIVDWGETYPVGW